MFPLPSSPPSTALLAALLLAATASAHGPAGEEKVRAPRMPWQRTLEDALALSMETGKPLLICVNADGESASEALAARRYRDPAFVALVEGFVPVLASPSRHREREHDDAGRRLEDPKFGRLVESEHLDIEPLVYERYFGGRRVAPRHLAVAPDGRILFDLFLLNDLGRIDDALRAHGVFDEDLPDAGRLSTSQLFASHDHAARQRLEELYLRGGSSKRLDLVRRALSGARSAQQTELVRMALRDEDPRVRLEGARAVARHPAGAPDFLLDAFRVAEGHDALQRELAEGLAALDLAGRDARTRLRLERWRAVCTALASVEEGFDVEGWRSALDAAGPQLAEAAVPDAEELERTLRAVDAALDARPADVELYGLQAHASLEFARLWIREGGGDASLMLEDARAAAERALELAPDSAQASGVLAVVAWLESDPEEAALRAEQALPGLRASAAGPLAAEVLDVLAQARVRAVYAALADREPLPQDAIRQAAGAFEVLLSHPSGTAEQAAAYLVFLDAIDGRSEEERVARAALRRFPDTDRIHGFYRHYVLRNHGAAGMGRAYEELGVPEGFEAEHEWYAALAILVGAERHADDGREERSLEEYRRSIELFEEVRRTRPEYADNSDHYIGLAHAGLARLHLERGELAEAVERIRRAVERSSSCFHVLDGRGRFPKQTVSELQGALRRDGDEGLSAALAAALAEHGYQG